MKLSEHLFLFAFGLIAIAVLSAMTRQMKEEIIPAQVQLLQQTHGQKN